MLTLIRGFRGHPSHPPMTDAAIGAMTVAALTLLAALLGFEEPAMVRAGIIALVIGVLASIPAIITGIADLLQITKGTPLRTTATIHGIVMTAATGLFAFAGLLLRDSYGTGRADTTGVVLALVAYAVLALGGWIGGSLVFVYGMRVLNEPDTPPEKALRPHS